MNLVQILLPLYDKQQNPFPDSYYHDMESELTEKFGGMTAYTRSPAKGLWKEKEDKTVKDDIVVLEVMTEKTDKEFWKQYKTNLEALFQQDAIIIRSSEVEVI